MDSDHQIHIFFFPFIAYGHMIPTIDIAKLFAARGIKTTIILTPLNASFFSKSIHRERSLGLDIHIQVIKFPAVEAGLPEGFESVNDLTSLDMVPNLSQAIKMLQEALERLIEEHKPDFIFADVLLPFATEAASKYGVPRFVFHGTSFFSQCVDQSLICHRPHEGIISDREAFVVPGLPDKIEMTRLQLHDKFKDEDASPTVAREQIREAEEKCYGILVNSFFELEPAYAIHYEKVMEKRVWSIGPVSLRNKDNLDKVQRGMETAIDEHLILNWLDSKKPQSVLHICFGSLSRFSKAQLLEIAAGLEDSGTSFIWVVRTIKKEEEEESWLPTGFEERMEVKGLIIRDWAPQVLILDHPAVGGFMTHCGWNSILEGLSAGVPMITWPIFAEQFHNEIFVTQVLKIGIRVGVEKWNSWIEPEDVEARKEEIANVVSRLMGDGEEGQNMRTRAKELSKMARKTVKEGGSSYENLTALINELKMVNKSDLTRQ
ncbi:scopoletin glucosyltransferase-like [Papaver somniferum]|uniref:scopoletin glucosyltransferase-like n=1 Tax=Papaver somniferum TaxID=3469 RepID=UPI000E6F6E97|nr:scopoletin glucosyltransferase-like [Papaver somniferum]